MPARHQTLQVALDWSYNLLSAGEQTLFRRLGIFAGGWMLPAAEAVTGAAELGADMLDSMSALAEKSLILVGHVPDEGPRFGMLETIREYAREQLTASSELELTRRRHADYYVTVAERTQTELQGSRQRAWFNYLEWEHDNLWTALRWSSAGGEPRLGLRIALALWGFWWLRGHVSEGRRWLEASLTQDRVAPDELRMLALEGLGTLVGWQSEYEQGATLLDEALHLSQILDYFDIQ